jgi:hypothetical protein
MDCGEDVRRNKAVSLAKQAEKGFIEGWLIDNQESFIEVMRLIKDGAPVQYAKLYLEAYKMGLVRETNININFNRQQDREGLQGLVRARMLPDHGQYVPFEEVRSAPEPVATPSMPKKQNKDV